MFENTILDTKLSLAWLVSQIAEIAIYPQQSSPAWIGGQGTVAYEQ